MTDLLLSAIPRVLPFECMRMRFMQEALLALVILAPMAASMGVHVVNSRMSFFADAISHSAFTGVAVGLLFSISPHWSMPLFAVFIGTVITFLRRRSALTEDTLNGVVFSTIVAFGLAIVSRDKAMARNIQQFLYGDILSVDMRDIVRLCVLAFVIGVFQLMSFNRMLYVGINPSLAKVHRVNTALYEYIFSGLLSLVIIFSVRAVGVLLVTGMLIVPAATARNIAKSAGTMFWWAVAASLFSAVAGLILSAQNWVGTASGATIILVSFVCFIASQIYAFARK